jgi:biopolymer transport protein ExbD
VRNPAVDARPPRGVNLTAMIDVVFLLLIFFVLTSYLSQPTVQDDLLLPEALTGRLDEDTRREQIDITLQTSGEVLLAGQPVTEAELKSRLAAEVQTSERELEVRIWASRDVPYARVEPIMIECARNGLWRISFAVMRRE